MNRNVKRAGLACAAMVVALGMYLVGIQMTGNFAVVIPGEVYRSNQPSGADIAAYADRYNIRTIVNLRGRHEKASWYKAEAAAARRLGITLLDFPMLADRRLDAAEADRLIAFLRTAERPLLIHCRSGSDRTGLASVIYLARIARVDEETAERQLSIRYGHIGIPFLSPTFAMDESWDDLEEADGVTASAGADGWLKNIVANGMHGTVRWYSEDP